jgi:SulP family sulfate permease
MQAPQFRPRIVDALRGYDRRRFFADVTAGVVVGFVALPLAMAFAIASGATPQAGLTTAIVAGFLISALGGTRVQVGGPTGSFIAILYGVVAVHGYDKLLTCTMMAGVILVVLGISGLGRVIQYIPYPVTMGFTSGNAIVIFSGQIKDFLGLPIEKLDPEFVGKCSQYVETIGGTQLPTLALGIVCAAVLILWPARWARRIPASIIVLLLGSVAASVFSLPVATIGSRFGELPRGLPAPQWPDVSFSAIGELIGPATTIALLGAIESLLSAVVADGLTDDRHDSNQELIAQGIANVTCPLFGGIPAVGAIARTATNVRCGATSPVAGIVHALTILVFLLALGPLASRIPMVALASILLVVSARMGEWHIFRRLPSLPASDSAVFLTTLALTVFFGLTLAVEVGIVLAALLFIQRVARLTSIAPITGGARAAGEGSGVLDPHRPPKGVQVFRVQGAFFFATANKLEGALRRMQIETHTLILVLDQVIDIDATGLRTLESLHLRVTKGGARLVLCGVRPYVRAMLDRSGWLSKLGAENVIDRLEDALASRSTPPHSATGQAVVLPSETPRAGKPELPPHTAGAPATASRETTAHLSNPIHREIP